MIIKIYVIIAFLGVFRKKSFFFVDIFHPKRFPIFMLVNNPKNADITLIVKNKSANKYPKKPIHVH